MQNPIAQAIIERFFDDAASQPEAFLAFFKQAVKGLSVQEMWAVMDILTDRLGENIHLLHVERLAEAA